MADQNIIDLISSQLLQGLSKEDIYKNLLEQGYSISSIQEGFESLPKPQQNSEESSKKIISIILLIAALLIGAGIFSFVASNWTYMGKLMKILVILFFMVAAYFSGWALKEKGDYQKTGNALYFLGLIIYGAGIFLVAQMFNVRSNWPDGFLIWMLGVIAFAWATEIIQYLYLAIFLGIVTITSDPFTIFYSFAGDSFLMTSSLLLLLSTAVTFAAGIIIRKKELAQEREQY